MTDLKEDYEVIPVLRSLLTVDNSTQPRKGLPQHWFALLFLNSGVGSFMSHKNQISESAVREGTYVLLSLLEKTRKSNHLQMPLQR